MNKKRRSAVIQVEPRVATVFDMETKTEEYKILTGYEFTVVDLTTELKACINVLQIDDNYGLVITARFAQ